jgi:hypothetical protein
MGATLSLVHSSGPTACHIQLGQYIWFYGMPHSVWITDHIQSGRISNICHNQYGKLVRAECVRCPWVLLQNEGSTIFGIIFAHEKPTWGFHEDNTFATESIKLENTYLSSPPWTRAPEKFRSCQWGSSGGSSVCRPVSEEPHRR